MARSPLELPLGAASGGSHRPQGAPLPRASSVPRSPRSIWSPPVPRPEALSLPLPPEPPTLSAPHGRTPEARCGFPPGAHRRTRLSQPGEPRRRTVGGEAARHSAPCPARLSTRCACGPYRQWCACALGGYSGVRVRTGQRSVCQMALKCVSGQSPPATSVTSVAAPVGQGSGVLRAHVYHFQSAVCSHARRSSFPAGARAALLPPASWRPRRGRVR